MSQTFYQLAQELSLPDNHLEGIIKRAGISCDSDFGGRFLWLTDDVTIFSKNRILLHTDSFGEFPVISLPAINMLEYSQTIKDLVNGFGLDSIAYSTLKVIPEIPNPSLSSTDLFRLSYFLACIWVDIKQETYRHRNIYWNPIISFDTPVYHRAGTVESWDKQCNILRANVLEIIDSIYRFLMWSYNSYSKLGAKYKPTKFPMTLALKETILKMPGVACLNTPGCKRVAFNMLTLIRSLIAQMCCMLLRRGNDAFVVKPTTEATLADDIKQVYLLIQKMESFINNG